MITISSYSRVCGASQLAQQLKKKKSNCSAEAEEDVGWIPGLGRSPGGGQSNPLQYSCRENPQDTGTWCATVHKELDTTEAT